MVSPSESMITEAIAAARAGDRSRARDLLTRLLRADSSKADYWVWMSAVVDTRREQVYCLESALRLDPTNRAALRGLVILGAREPEASELASAPQIQRRHVASLAAGPAVRRSLNINLRSLGIIGAVVLGLLLIGAGILWTQRPRTVAVAPTLRPPTGTPTQTPPEPTATDTPVPVETRVFRTAVPAEFAGTPLAFLVPISPTPTPILGMTPHPAYEAYGIGIAALQRGDYEGLLEAMNQVITLDPELPDAHYFRGEALRALGRPREATLAYDRAILRDSNFLPAYVGRGRALLDITLRENNEIKAADLPQDYDRALDRDTTFLPALVAKSEFYAGLRLWKPMEEMLQVALDDGTIEPVIYVLISDAQFNRTNFEAALENAIIGSGNDPTLIEGYLALGRAHVELEEYVDALPALQTYSVYRPEDHRGWGFLARAYYGLDEFDLAFEAAERALEFNDRYAPAYLIRGLVNYKREAYDEGLDDVYQARRYGSETYQLNLAIGRGLYYQGNFTEALRSVNLMIEQAPTNAEKAEGYVWRALIYEATNPPLLDDAIRNWRWVLTIQDAAEELQQLARDHLEALDAEPFTLTPASTGSATPSRTPTPTRTPTPPGS